MAAKGIKPPYRSKYEQEVCEALEEQGHKFKYEPEAFEYTIKSKYTPDLQLGNGVYVELKGYFDWEDRRKLECVLRDNPGLNLRILFSRDNPIRKGSRVLYSDWAKRVGIQYGVGRRIPEDWLK